MWCKTGQSNNTASYCWNLITSTLDKPFSSFHFLHSVKLELVDGSKSKLLSHCCYTWNLIRTFLLFTHYSPVIQTARQNRNKKLDCLIFVQIKARGQLIRHQWIWEERDIIENHINYMSISSSSFEKHNPSQTTVHNEEAIQDKQNWGRMGCQDFPGKTQTWPTCKFGGFPLSHIFIFQRINNNM